MLVLALVVATPVCVALIIGTVMGVWAQAENIELRDCPPDVRAYHGEVEDG